MSDLFGSLIERTFRQATTVRPATPPMFLSAPSDGEVLASAGEEFLPGHPRRPETWFGGSQSTAGLDAQAVKRDQEPDLEQVHVNDVGRPHRVSIREEVRQSQDGLHPGEPSWPAASNSRTRQSRETEDENSHRASRGTAVRPASAPDREGQAPLTQSLPLRVVPKMAMNGRREEHHPVRERSAGSIGDPPRPIVRVTIGRVEVKAVMQNSAPAMPVPRPSGPQPRSLAEYLKERNEAFR